jgi:hypothetical protein
MNLRCEFFTFLIFLIHFPTSSQFNTHVTSQILLALIYAYYFYDFVDLQHSQDYHISILS